MSGIFYVVRDPTNVIVHSAKGSHWKKHKYIKIVGDRYVYAKESVGNKLGIDAYKDYLKADKERIDAYGKYKGAQDLTNAIETGSVSTNYQETVMAAARVGASNIASTNLQNFANSKERTSVAYNKVKSTPLGKVVPALELGRGIVNSVTGSTTRRYKKAYNQGVKEADNASLVSAAKKIKDLKEASLKKKGANKNKTKVVQTSSGNKVKVSSAVPRPRVKNVTGEGKTVYKRGYPDSSRKGRKNSVGGNDTLYRPTNHKYDTPQQAAWALEDAYANELKKKKKK